MYNKSIKSLPNVEKSSWALLIVSEIRPRNNQPIDARQLGFTQNNMLDFNHKT